MTTCATTALAGAAMLAIAASPCPAHTTTSAAGPTTSASSHAAAVRADDAQGGGKLLLMLDSSGSMKDRDPSGSSKMDAAKRAIGTVVDGLPANAQVGLRVYGATRPGGRPTPAACRDTQLVSPVGPLDKGALKGAVARFTPKGETPIAYSLGQALKDLGPSGKRNIVLVSDGEESCTPDPCPQIKKLVANGVDLRIDTVGFAVGDKAQKQLQCLADAGHGTYYDARDAGELTTSLEKLSTRAFRPFSVAGTPIRGTTSPLDAPHLAAGQYLDSVQQTDGTRYYRLQRRRGSTMRVAVTARPAVDADDDSHEGWMYSVKNLKGDSCDSQSSSRFDAIGFNDIVTGTMTVAPDSGSCGNDTDLVLEVKRPDGGSASTPTEIKVMEEGAVSNLDSLPEGATDVPDALRPPVKPARPVVGGTSFNDAQPIGSGTYVADVAPGEMAFFKAPLDFGQRATFAVDGPTDRFTDWPDDTSPLQIDGDVWTPARQQFDYAHNHGMFTRKRPDDGQVRALPTVDYRNRQSTNSTVRVVSIAGDYYFTVMVGAKDAGKDVKGSVPVQFSLLVQGSKAGAPEYGPLGPTGPTGAATGKPSDGASRDTSGSASGSESESVGRTGAGRHGVPIFVWVLGGLAAAGIAITGGVMVARRRR